jgi:hypothetical protein
MHSYQPRSSIKHCKKDMPVNRARGVIFRKAILGGCFGLVGAGIGALVAKAAVSTFKGASEWELPALVVGSMALAFLAIFIGLVISERRAAANIKN